MIHEMLEEQEQEQVSAPSLPRLVTPCGKGAFRPSLS